MAVFVKFIFEVLHLHHLCPICVQFLIILLRYQRKIKGHFLSAQTEIQILKYYITYWVSKYLGVSHCHFTGLNLKNILRHPKFSKSIERLKSYMIVIWNYCLEFDFFGLNGLDILNHLSVFQKLLSFGFLWILTYLLKIRNCLFF